MITKYSKEIQETCKSKNISKEQEFFFNTLNGYIINEVSLDNVKKVKRSKIKGMKGVYNTNNGTTLEVYFPPFNHLSSAEQDTLKAKITLENKEGVKEGDTNLVDKIIGLFSESVVTINKIHNKK